MGRTLRVSHASGQLLTSTVLGGGRSRATWGNAGPHSGERWTHGKDAVAGSIRGSNAATEIPGRELPRRRLELDRPDDSPYDVYDFFDPVPAAETDATVDGYERIDTRPRVRVYGCCA